MEQGYRETEMTSERTQKDFLACSPKSGPNKRLLMAFLPHKSRKASDEG